MLNKRFEESLKARFPAFERLIIPGESEKERALPIVTPPEKVVAVEVVAPREVTVARVSASEVSALEEMVMVLLEVETVTLPLPLAVNSPVDPFRVSTPVFVIVGF